MKNDFQRKCPQPIGKIFRERSLPVGAKSAWVYNLSDTQSTTMYKSEGAKSCSEK